MIVAVISCEDAARESGEGVSRHVASCRHRRGANCMWRWGHARTCCRQASARDNGIQLCICPAQAQESLGRQEASGTGGSGNICCYAEHLEPLKQRRLIQVQLHCLQQQQFLSRHPRAARHSPWCRTRALLAHPARVQQQARSAILPSFSSRRYLLDSLANPI